MRHSLLITALLIGNLTACCPRSALTDRTGEGSRAGETVPDSDTAGPLKNIYFAFDSSRLDGNAQSTLRSNADWLKENPRASVTIEGHCDSRGTDEYNLALGERRAHSAYEFLTTLGIEKSRMSTVSYGEDRPAVPNAQSEAEHAQNRRDHFRVQQ